MGEITVRAPTVIVDLLTLSTVGCVMVLIEKTTMPFRRGFFCSDESIRYPRVTHTKFNSKSLAATCLLISFTTITITEFRLQRNRGSGTFLTRPVPLWFISMYRSLIDFLFGCAASQLITDIGKYSIGRLRPNFLDVCVPNIDLSNCSQYGHRYIENYVCMKSNDDAKESRVSFPSGHSSFSAFTMLYVAIYIQVKWRASNNALRLLKSGIQLALLLLAYYTALSRVMDNKHHWSDVSAGALVGAVSASLTARYVSGIVGSSKVGMQGGDAESLSMNTTPGAIRYRQSGAGQSHHQNDIEAGRGPKESVGSVPNQPPPYDTRLS